MSKAKEEIAQALLAEGRCALTLQRSTAGRIVLTVKTHSLGSIKIELSTEQYTDLMFGLGDVDCTIPRVLPERTPTYPKP